MRKYCLSLKKPQIKNSLTIIGFDTAETEAFYLDIRICSSPDFGVRIASIRALAHKPADGWFPRRRIVERCAAVPSSIAGSFARYDIL